MNDATNTIEMAYYMSFFKNVETPKLAALKRVGPLSLKFKKWKHEVEDALVTLLGPESLAARSFDDIPWPDDPGPDFKNCIDEAKIILDTATPHIVLKHPSLRGFDPAMPRGSFPPPLETVVFEIDLCLKSGALTAASVLVRKAVEVAIFLRFEQDRMTSLITTEKGDTLSFSEKVDRAQSQNYLSPQRAKEVKQIKSYGDAGAHSYKIIIDQEDMKQAMGILRLALGELFPESHEKHS
jgi:hypothetical protein